MANTTLFNCRMDPATKQMLDDLAEVTRRNRADIIRELINNRHSMMTNRVPRCANGEGCIMAGMWIQNRGALDAIKQQDLELHEPPPLPNLDFASRQ